MKKWFLAAIALALASHALAVDMARPDGTTSWTTTGATKEYSTGQCDTILVTVQSSGAQMTGTIVWIEQSSDNVSWQQVQRIDNPGPNDLAFYMPRMNFTRVNFTVVGTGTGIAKLDGWSGAQRRF